MNKITIASDMLKAIRGLELSPSEVKCVTLTWFSFYPFLIEDFGCEIKIHTPAQKVMDEIEKLKTMFQNSPITEVENVVSVADVVPTAATETQQESSPVKGGDTSGLDDETVIPEKSTASPDTSPTDNPKVLVLPRKGYSKNGKRLGRPPRKKLEEKEKVVDEKPVEEPQKAANSEPVEEIPEKIVPTAVATTKTSPPVVSTEEVSQDVIDELKYGKEYEYDLLYLVNNSYARSRCRLREEAGVKPVGVIIPYKVQNLRYEIVVYYTDEHVIIPIATAKKYAESKLLPYKKASWRIKNQSDDMHIRPALSVINEIFKKMGGDELKGTYVDGSGSKYYGSNGDAGRKIRYVCNILLNPNKHS